VTSLGKGFYEFNFSSIEDMRTVRSVGSWNLSHGILKLFAWSKDFNPIMQQHSTAQVLVKIYGLSQEYLCKIIIFAIAISVGTPIYTNIIISKEMIDRSFGDHVRVLVDIDLAEKLRYKFLVERKGYDFFVDLEYENLSDFFSYCMVHDHHIDNCIRMKVINRENHGST